MLLSIYQLIYVIQSDLSLQKQLDLYIYNIFCTFVFVIWSIFFHSTIIGKHHNIHILQYICYATTCDLTLTPLSHSKTIMLTCVAISQHRTSVLFTSIIDKIWYYIQFTEKMQKYQTQRCLILPCMVSIYNHRSTWLS
jgi:hypothetical protein